MIQISSYREDGKSHRKWHILRAAVIISAAASMTAGMFLPDTAAGEWLSRHITPVIIWILAGISGIFPFSAAEILLYMLIPALIIILIICIRRIIRSNFRIHTFINQLINFICVLSAAYLIFFWGYSVCFNRQPIEKSMDFERHPITADDLYRTAGYLIEQTNADASKIKSSGNGASEMPFEFPVMSEKVMKAYHSAFGDNEMLSQVYIRSKPVLWSKGMSMLSITGIFIPFTGEANINTDYPDFIIPFTAAHEMTHQNGIAREEEANFAAFIACRKSDDAYIRYSGNLNALIYVGNALYEASPEKYAELFSELSETAACDLAALSEYNASFEGKAGEIASDVNDGFLKVNGQQEGAKSYGRMVDLVTAWYISESGS